MKLLDMMVACQLFFQIATISAFSFRRVSFGTISSRRTQHQSQLFSKTENSRSARAEAATRSLENLRERQMEELAETDRLLQQIRQVEVSSHSPTNISSTNKAAASILAGVDYGFQSRSEGASFSDLNGGSPAFEGYGPPSNLWKLGTQQFMRNLNAMKGEYADETDFALTDSQKELHAQLDALTLNATGIWDREMQNGPIEAPFVIKIPYFGLCYMLDEVFDGKYIPSRFFLLETVARMPYFSYITMLHLYETLGFWRRSAGMKRIHFAEELNEFHHLLIMESLGGDQAWWVRFLAQHSAIVYYVALCLLWGISPSLSYRFSELLETHAVSTYGQFLDENEEALKKLPPPLPAIEYYAFGSSDPFYAEFQTTAMSQGQPLRRPGESMLSLYEVFQAIKADELDHVSTMEACLDPEANTRSPSVEKRILLGLALISIVGFTASNLGGEASLIDSLPADVVGETSTGGAVDAVVASISAAAAKFSLDETSQGGLGKAAVELEELGATGALLEGSRRAVIGALQAVLRFIGILL
jgi:ubiquinol oxidase